MNIFAGGFARCPFGSLDRRSRSDKVCEGRPARRFKYVCRRRRRSAQADTASGHSGGGAVAIMLTTAGRAA